SFSLISTDIKVGSEFWVSVISHSSFRCLQLLLMLCLILYVAFSIFYCSVYLISTENSTTDVMMLSHYCKSFHYLTVFLVQVLVVISYLSILFIFFYDIHNR